MKEIVVIKHYGSLICLENINNDEQIAFAYKVSKNYLLLTENSIVVKSYRQSCSSVEEVIKLFHKIADENDMKIVSEEEFKKYELLK